MIKLFVKRAIICVISLFIFYNVNAQKTKVFGVVSDKLSGETLIGANVTFGEGQGTITDFNGNYELNLEAGSYDFTISFIGYESQSLQVQVAGATQRVDVRLSQKVLKEVKIVADIAIDRETPVAFSTIPSKQLEEELANQDIPMILNSTPGVYATNAGGGDGDARINIRGFDQRNMAVMVDGVPVNDMENGWVYWSNWFGLDAVTKTLQVQRGLGASKLAIPSVGGTINILTKGIDQKRYAYVKQTVGHDGYLKTSLGYNSGRLKNGWGFSVAGAYKRGSGWVDELNTEGFFYYGRVDKAFGENHVLTLSGYGAPQKHNQRSFKTGISVFDQEKALELGIPDSVLNTPSSIERGLKYNPYWGRVDTLGKNEIYNERLNYYHKPQFNLRHTWNVSDKIFLSNTAYLSIGNGGATRFHATPGVDAETGQYLLSGLYAANVNTTSVLDDGRRISSNYLKSSRNNHFWYGVLSNLNYDVSEKFDLTFGIDLRSYKGEHYREIYDLFGGDVVVNGSNLTVNQPSTTDKAKVVGDKIDFYNDGLVRWGGTYGLLEYKKDDKWSAFLNVSGAMSAYKRIDYFKRKDVELPNGEFALQALGYSYYGPGNNDFFSDTLIYNNGAYNIRRGTLYVDEDGNTITDPSQRILNGEKIAIDSDKTRYASTDWIYIPSYTFKAGANLNINDNLSVFTNMGYLSKAPQFNNIIDFNNNVFDTLGNETVYAIELGSGLRFSKWAANVNLYNTAWINKPGGLFSTPNANAADDEVFFLVDGIDAVHRGIEIDGEYRFAKGWEFEGLISLGDWTWNSSETLVARDRDGGLSTDPDPEVRNSTITFDANGVHVGDAAQTQFAASLRYEFAKTSVLNGLYFKGKGTYFGKNYTDMNPASLGGSFAQRESYKLPNYFIVDANAGYQFYVKDFKVNVGVNLLNVLNESYITDGRNNDFFLTTNTNSFDARSTSVFFGQGFRWMTSIKITY